MEDNELRSVYFIGIGGIGMSALARYFKNYLRSKNGVVGGSDAVRSSITDELVKEGIRVKIGHKKGNIPADASLIIYNRAIPHSELAAPEFRAALKSGIPMRPYAEALGTITEQFKTIAITGSHGKSTTTALMGLALVAAGLDPTILVGTKLKELGGKNIRLASARRDRREEQYLVLEADDYGAAFLEYSPFISVVTNIDREHMDFYKNFANVKKTFLKFLSRTRVGGAMVLNGDDVPLRSLAPQIKQIAKKKNIRVIWYSMASKNVNDLRKVMKIPGDHNISNALAVLAVTALLKVSEKKILVSLGAYNGAWRRMEYRGKFIIPKSRSHAKAEALVYDDYAHHPTEIKATLAAFKQKFPKSPLVCVFQPHQAKRLDLLFKEFIAAFDVADVTFILPLYKVLGRDEKFPNDSEALVRNMNVRSPEKLIFYVPQPRRLKKMIHDAILNLPTGRGVPFPVVIMMGAGDIVEYTKKLL